MNLLIKNKLQIAYLQTQYSIESDEGTIWISPLDINLDLKLFCQAHDVTSWAIITPFNPGSEILTDQENEARLKVFIEKGLHDERTGVKKWLYFGSVSKPTPDSKNPISIKNATPETGFFIMNIFPWEAIRLGHQYGQNAIVIGTADGYTEIAWCDHESLVYFSKSI